MPDYYTEEAHKRGFTSKGEISEVFNLKGAVWESHLDGALKTFDKIVRLKTQWDDTPEGTYNMRSYLPFTDKRTRKEITRDNLNIYLDQVEKDYKLDAKDMARLGQLTGLNLDKNGHVASNAELEKEKNTANWQGAVAMLERGETPPLRNDPNETVEVPKVKNEKSAGRTNDPAVRA